MEKPDEFAFLTNVIHQEWTGLTVKKHKDLKGLNLLLFSFNKKMYLCSIPCIDIATILCYTLIRF